MEAVAGNLYITTDDGSYGRSGMVTKVIEDLVTKEGKVFVWPPYEYENKYLINDTSEVAESSGEATGDMNVVVANLPITIAQ